MISGILYKPGCCPKGRSRFFKGQGGENATERLAKTRFSYELTLDNFSYELMVLV